MSIREELEQVKTLFKVEADNIRRKYLDKLTARAEQAERELNEHIKFSMDLHQELVECNQQLAAERKALELACKQLDLVYFKGTMGHGMFTVDYFRKKAAEIGQYYPCEECVKEREDAYQNPILKWVSRNMVFPQSVDSDWTAPMEYKTLSVKEIYDKAIVGEVPLLKRVWKCTIHSGYPNCLLDNVMERDPRFQCSHSVEKQLQHKEDCEYWKEV